MPGGFWNEERDEEIKKLFADGFSLPEVAGKYGITPSSILSRAHRQGYYEQVPLRRISGPVCRTDNVSFTPVYCPRRDGQLHHADLTAELMGDPPIGRREIMQKLDAA